MTTTYTGRLTIADAQGMSDEGLASTIAFLEDAIAGKFGELTDVDATLSNHLVLTTEARTRRTVAPKEATVTEPRERATAHVGCTHPRTKVARAACRRARARAASPLLVLVKTDAQLEAARLRIAAKGCQGTVKSGARAGLRCSRPVAQGKVVCSGHARSFKI